VIHFEWSAWTHEPCASTGGEPRCGCGTRRIDGNFGSSFCPNDAPTRLAAKLPALSHGYSTHATIALRAGVYPKVVSESLGHASVASTLDVYRDSPPDMQETAAVLIAELLRAPRLQSFANRSRSGTPETTKPPPLRGFLVAAGQGLEP
jgi:hypothetical protein